MRSPSVPGAPAVSSRVYWVHLVDRLRRPALAVNTLIPSYNGTSVRIVIGSLKGWRTPCYEAAGGEAVLANARAQHAEM